MHRIVRLALVPLALLAADRLAAQSFQYPNFSSTVGLTLNGSAVQSGNNLRLTNNAIAQVGSAFYSTAVPVTEGFDTTFDFVLSTQTEGMAFVIQGSPNGPQALGGNYWGLGYGFGASSNPISNSLVVEIDAVQNGFLSDSSSNEVSVHTTGAFGNSENEGVSIGRMTPSTNLHNAGVHKMRVAYEPGTLRVFVNNMTTPVLTLPWTFETGGTFLSGGQTGGLGLSGTTAWVGFTSATPAATTNQFGEIRNWTWTSFQLPHPCYTGNVLAGSTGPHDVLTIGGTSGGVFRTVLRAIADPWSLEVAPPPGETAAPFVLLGWIGVADASTVTATPWGSACFPPVAVIDLGPAVAPFQVAVPPGIALDLSLTFQAVMATNSAVPSQIELSNAVALTFNAAPTPSATTVTPNSATVGSTITVNGSGFSPFATVTAGGVPATVLTAAPQQITFAMPAAATCGGQVVVRNPDGQTASLPFNPTPTITSQVNTQGPAAGGTTYVVIGTGYAPGTTATIGGVPANVTSATAGAVVMITPPGTPGPKTVVITTPGGCSVTSTFTYL